MNNIENIIEKYKKELMDFSLQNPSISSDSVPTMATVESMSPDTSSKTGNMQNNSEQSITEDPIPVAEEGVVGDFFPEYSNLEDFLAKNPQKGTLKIQLSAANQAFPVTGAQVAVDVELSDNNTVNLFEGLSDINGIVDDITLPAPSSSPSQSPNTASIRPFATYTISVQKPQYAKATFKNVPIFANVKSIQQIDLVPLVDTGEQPPDNLTVSPEPYLNLRGAEESGNTDNS